MMEEDFIEAIGALCEICGLVLSGLLRNGFTREGAISIITEIMIARFSN